MSLVESHSAVSEVDARLADLAERHKEFEGRAAEVARADAEANELFEKALTVALTEGGPVPTRPAPQLAPSVDFEVRSRFRQEKAALFEERQRVVAQVYDDVLSSARTQAGKAVEAARPLLAKLTEQLELVDDALTAVKRSRDARNSLAANSTTAGRRQFNDRSLTLAVFARLVDAGADPVAALLDLDGDWPPEQRQLGFVADRRWPNSSSP